MNVDLNGKTALITGATRGIGKAIADEFLRSGAQVVLTGTKPDDIEQLAAANDNPHIKWHVADFSTQEGIELFINELKNIYPIDICINNAGINIIKSFGEYSVAEYPRLLSSHSKAHFMLVQHIIPGMKKRGYGRIVNIASIWSHITKPEHSLYIICKTGLVEFTKSMSIRVRFLQSLKFFMDTDDVLVLISSSSKSENIFRAAEYAKKVGIRW